MAESHREAQGRLFLCLKAHPYRLPEIWDDPRQFAGNGAGVTHAKVIVIDRITAFVTSANFTEAALTRNIEAGVMIRQPRFAERLTTYFEGLMSKQQLRRVV